MRILVLTLIVIGIIGCCFLYSRGKTVEQMPTQRKDAELILKNLAVGMRMYSTMTGGGGDSKFTGDMSKLQHFVMKDAFAACYEKTPYHGFIVELAEYPTGDDYKTNFRFIAKPASGYTGEAYAIDKTEETIPLSNKE